MQKSIVAEARLVEPTQVLHRTLNLEERDPAGDRLLARRRVEVWQGADRGAFARRLYDERDRLVAGEWGQADGSRKLYRRGNAPRNGKSAKQGREVEAALLTENLMWRLELSSSSFSALVGQGATATLEDHPNVYVLSYQLPPEGVPVADGAVLKATLTINKADLRAIEQKLLVRIRDGNPQSAIRNSASTALPKAASSDWPPQKCQR